MSDFAGVARSTIYDWQKLPGWPAAPDGSVALWDIAVWRDRSVSGETVEDDEESGVSSPMLEKWREERWLMAKLDREEREGQLISRERMHAFVMRVAGLFRGWLDRLQRQHGEEFYEMGVDVLQDIQSETEREFGESDDAAIANS